MEGEKSEEFVRETNGLRRRGRPVVRWQDKLNEYMHEKVADRRVGIEQVRVECLVRKRQSLLCRDYPLRGCSWRE